MRIDDVAPREKEECIREIFPFVACQLMEPEVINDPDYKKLQYRAVP
jgi:hypothetical protein